MADGDGTNGRQRSAINSTRYVVAEYVRVGVWLCCWVGVYLNFGGRARGRLSRPDVLWSWLVHAAVDQAVAAPEFVRRVAVKAGEAAVFVGCCWCTLRLVRPWRRQSLSHHTTDTSGQYLPQYQS